MASSSVDRYYPYKRTVDIIKLHDDYLKSRNFMAKELNTLRQCAIVVAVEEFSRAMVDFSCNLWIKVLGSLPNGLANRASYEIAFCGRLFHNFNKISDAKIAEIFCGSENDLHPIIRAGLHHRLTTPGCNAIRTVIEIMLDDDGLTKFRQPLQQATVEWTQLFDQNLTNCLRQRGDIVQGDRTDAYISHTNVLEICRMLKNASDDLQARMDVATTNLDTSIVETQSTPPTISELDSMPKCKKALELCCGELTVLCRKIKEKVGLPVDVSPPMLRAAECLREFARLRNDKTDLTDRLIRTVCQGQLLGQMCRVRSDEEQGYILAMRFSMMKFAIFEQPDKKRKISAFHLKTNLADHLFKILNSLFSNNKLYKASPARMHYDITTDAKRCQPPSVKCLCPAEQQHTTTNFDSLGLEDDNEGKEVFAYQYFEQNAHIAQCYAKMYRSEIANKIDVTSTFHASAALASSQMKKAFVDMVTCIWQEFSYPEPEGLIFEITLVARIMTNLTDEQRSLLKLHPKKDWITRAASLLLTPLSKDKFLLLLKIVFIEKLIDIKGEVVCSLDKVGASFKAALIHWAGLNADKFGETFKTCQYTEKVNATVHSNQDLWNFVTSLKNDFDHGCLLDTAMSYLDELFFHCVYVEITRKLADEVSRRLKKIDAKVSLEPQRGLFVIVAVRSEKSEQIINYEDNVKNKFSVVQQTPSSGIKEGVRLPRRELGSRTVADGMAIGTYLKNRAKNSNPNHGNSGEPTQIRRKVAEEDHNLSVVGYLMEKNHVRRLNKEETADGTSELSLSCKRALVSIGEIYLALKEFVRLSPNNANDQDESSTVSCIDIFKDIKLADGREWTWELASGMLELLEDQLANDTTEKFEGIHDSNDRCFNFKMKNGSTVSLSYFNVYHLSMIMKAFNVGISPPVNEDDIQSEDGGGTNETLNNDDGSAIEGLQVDKMTAFWDYIRFRLIEDSKSTLD